jgi:hypothetical protein
VTYTRRDDLLDSYRAARIADEDAREERDLGYDTERAMHKAEGYRQPVTLAAFLRDAQQLAPSPAEREAVWTAYLTDNLSLVAQAGLAYETATRARDLAVHEALTEGGWSLRRVARLFGCKHQAVQQMAARHARRTGKAS